MRNGGPRQWSGAVSYSRRSASVRLRYARMNHTSILSCGSFGNGSDAGETRHVAYSLSIISLSTHDGRHSPGDVSGGRTSEPGRSHTAYRAAEKPRGSPPDADGRSAQYGTDGHVKTHPDH